MRLVTFSAGFLLLATTAAAQSGPEPASQDAIRRTLGEAVGAVLRADGVSAVALLQTLPAEGLSENQTRFRACAMERLDPGGAPPPLPPEAGFTQRALQAYREYWRAAATSPGTRDVAETALAARLSGLLQRPDLDSMSALEDPVLAAIRAEGGHALAGRTGVLRELMIWNRQDERDVTVALPEGPHTTRVYLLDDFASSGWSHWLACGVTSTGGWAKSDGIYAIASAYSSLEDENFRVNLLTHETQHFADYQSWPNLPGYALEYRAKLAELATAETTLPRMIAGFQNNQGDDEADAHSHANRRVLAAVRSRLGLAPDTDLGAVPGPDLRDAARLELIADTALRNAPPS